MITVVCVSLIMMNIALLQVLNRIRPILVGIVLGILSKAILNIMCISQLSIFWCEFKYRTFINFICNCATSGSTETLSF